MTRWLVEQRKADFYAVETRRGRKEAGASADWGTVVVTFLIGAGGSVAGRAFYESLAHIVRKRLVPDKHAADRSARLERLEVDEASDYLRALLASALERRRADFALIELKREGDEVEGTFETTDGERFRIFVGPDSHYTEKVEPARPDDESSTRHTPPDPGATG